ncbi:MAG: hypothetical protein K5839_07485 [Treponemataceae bacterium]|nr:hypothetical protein [Treponemataceae bacterium]
MLTKILSKESCACCKFCCSFRKSSLWETPTFTRSEKEKLESKYECIFKPLKDEIFTLNLSDVYCTSNPQEEAACFFLDKNKGCQLNDDEKPFDCKIWPFRVMEEKNSIFVTIAKTCPSIQKINDDVIFNFYKNELKALILKRLEENKGMIHPMNANYKKIEEIFTSH